MKKAEKVQTAQQIDLHTLSTGKGKFTAQADHTMGSRMDSVNAGLRQCEAWTMAEWP